jgi:type IV pilus assembly protein PilM
MGVFDRFCRLSPIGLDIGSRAVKAVQLARRGRSISFHAAALFPADCFDLSGETRKPRLDEVLSRRGFIGNEVVVAMPGEQLRTEWLELPPRDSGAPLEKIARTEMSRIAQWNDSAFEIASWDLPTTSRPGATAVMAVAARSTDVESLAEKLAANGLETVAVDAAGCALARCVAAQSRAHLVPVLDIGWNRVTIVLAFDGAPIYQRLLSDAGFGLLHSAVMNEANLNAEQAEYVLRQIGLEPAKTSDAPAAQQQLSRLRSVIERHFETAVEELEASVAYATHKHPSLAVDRVLLTGGGAEIAGLQAQLSQRLSAKVELLAPTRCATAPAHASELANSPAMALATGLAMHESD